MLIDDNFREGEETFTFPTHTHSLTHIHSLTLLQTNIYNVNKYIFYTTIEGKGPCGLEIRTFLQTLIN